MQIQPDSASRRVPTPPSWRHRELSNPLDEARRLMALVARQLEPRAENDTATRAVAPPPKAVPLDEARDLVAYLKRLVQHQGPGGS